MPKTPGELPIITTKHLSEISRGVSTQDVMPLSLGEIRKRAMAIALLNAVSSSFKDLHLVIGTISEQLFQEALDSSPKERGFVYDLSRRVREHEVKDMVNLDPVLHQLAINLAKKALGMKGKGIDVYFPATKKDIFNGIAEIESPNVVFRDFFETFESKLDPSIGKWDISFRIPVLTDALFCALLNKYSTNIELLKPLLDKIKRRSIGNAWSNIEYIRAVFKRSEETEFLAILNDEKYKIIAENLDVLAQGWVKKQSGTLPQVYNVSRDLFAEFAILYFPKS